MLAYDNKFTGSRYDSNIYSLSNDGYYEDFSDNLRKYIDKYVTGGGMESCLDGVILLFDKNDFKISSNDENDNDNDNKSDEKFAIENFVVRTGGLQPTDLSINEYIIEK
jgi:hypothetical protein